LSAFVAQDMKPTLFIYLFVYLFIYLFGGNLRRWSKARETAKKMGGQETQEKLKELAKKKHKGKELANNK